MVSIFRETNIYKKKIEESCVTRTTMLLSSTQGISKSIVRVFFFFFLKRFCLTFKKKKEKWRETKYSMKVTKRKMYMYITMKCKWIK